MAERSAAAEQRARELARSENALRQQTSILQSILNSMGDGVIVADASANILLSNPAADRLIRAGLGTGDRQHDEQFSNLPSAEPLTARGSNEHPAAARHSGRDHRRRGSFPARRRTLRRASG